MGKRNKAYSLTLASTTLLLLLIIFSSTGLVAATQNDLSAEYAYVPNEKSNTVSVINTTTDTVISTIPVGNVPVGVAVSLDGTKVYVTNFGNDDFPGRNVSIIDTATEEVTSINVEEGRPGKPSGVAVYPYEQKAYVAKLLNEKIRAVDLSTNEVSDIHVGTDPRGVAITPEGSKVYVANTGSNTVSVIDTATNSVIKTVGVGEAPYGVAVNKNGTKVYVTNSGSDTVSIIDTETKKVIGQPISVGTCPSGLGQFIGSVPGSRVETRTTLDLSLSPSQSSAWGSRALTATVTATSKVAEKPSGTVTFMEGATPIGTKTLSNGQAILETSSLSKGNHSIIARYKGDNNFRPSTSSNFPLTIEDISSRKSILEHPIVSGVILAVVGSIISLLLYIIKKKYGSVEIL